MNSKNNIMMKLVNLILVILISVSVNAQNNYDKVFDYGMYLPGLAKVKKDGKYGFINQKGETVVECKFDDIDDFGIYYPGWARVKISSKYGFINQKGETVVECKFDDIDDFGIYFPKG